MKYINAGLVWSIIGAFVGLAIFIIYAAIKKKLKTGKKNSIQSIIRAVDKRNFIYCFLA